MVNPAFVFVGGVSHTPVFFEPLIDVLHGIGFNATAVAYPTVGPPAETVGFGYQDEITAIQKVVASYVEDHNQDVILTCHSYGGWPGSRAVPGWDKATREKEGKKNGIIEMVFLSAFLIPDNANTSDYSYLPPWLTVENDTRVPNEQAIPILFNDLPPTEAQFWLSQFQPQRNDFTAPTVPNAPWNLTTPKVYIHTMNDLTATFDFQSSALQGIPVDNTWSIKSLHSGHESFLSHPVNLAKVLLEPTF